MLTKYLGSNSLLKLSFNSLSVPFDSLLVSPAYSFSALPSHTMTTGLGI